MTFAMKAGSSGAAGPAAAAAGARPGAALRRGVLLAAFLAGAGVGVAGTGAAETAGALAGLEAELVRLLRFMALLKAAMALGAVSAVWWRLGSTASAGWMLTYLAAAAATAAGPGLIWGMAHVGLGALLLHAGLAAMLVALWRDPAVAARLGAMARRRASGIGQAQSSHGNRWSDSHRSDGGTT